MPARPIVRHDHDDNLDFASVSIHRRVDVVTTTLYSSPGSTGIAASNASSVPIPAIAGGACAGVALAIIAVVGWKWWGRSIEKEQQRLRQDKVSLINSFDVRSS
ncbi:hypothetical protein BD410DRAFT_785849 [Rickenella mellea]|uniref:Uncharacterized protein n=1 Tax=Rickenella mellea TaxID=50990 RepID=A0A4Y7QDX3_9AGAM|nr:hypothetical protein BD410DRAFT_785849 [Rickenella mellea]